MMVLTLEQLSMLTGLKQPAAQVRWLKLHGWIYALGGDGLPKVATAYFERRMVCESIQPTAP